MMAESPERSLPHQAERWSDLKAAYRLLSNPRVDPGAIGEAHRRGVRESAAAHPVVLCVQDDSDLQAARVPGGREMQHTALAVRPEGELLGVLDQRWFPKVSPPKGETRAQRMKRWRESCVWSETAEAVGPMGGSCRLVHVADRASDDLNFLTACEREGHGFVIRAQHDRRVDGGVDKLWPRLGREPVRGTITVRVGEQRNARGRIVRREREADVAVRAARVRLETPYNHPGEHEAREVWAIHLREPETPDDAEPIDWMLLSSEPAKTFEDARRLVGYYQRRWVIEEWHRVLKEGCRLERSQLDEPADLRRLAAVKSVVAVRMLGLRDLADAERSGEMADQPLALRRTTPQLWIALVAALAKVPPERLTPRQFWRTIALRGGWIGRKSDGRPGWKTLWRGWSDLIQMAHGAELAQNHPPPHRSG